MRIEKNAGPETYLKGDQPEVILDTDPLKKII